MNILISFKQAFKQISLLYSIFLVVSMENYVTMLYVFCNLLNAFDRMKKKRVLLNHKFIE